MNRLHRFHVMHCENIGNRKQVAYSHPCTSSCKHSEKIGVKPNPICVRCGRSNPGTIKSCLGNVPNPCTHKLAYITHKRRKSDKNKSEIKTSCSDIPITTQKSKGKKKKKKNNIQVETTELYSPCSILSLQNKRCLVNTFKPRYRKRPSSRKDNTNLQKSFHHVQHGIRKNTATSTGSMLEPQCVQLRKQINEEEGCTLRVASSCTRLVSKANNDYTVKCDAFKTTVSKGCMCELGCCNENICNQGDGPCSGPNKELVPRKLDKAPCKLADCPNALPFPPQPTCWGDFTCGPNPKSDLQCKMLQTYDDSGPYEHNESYQRRLDEQCKQDKLVQYPWPNCVTDIPCRPNEVPLSQQPDCFDLPCQVNEYAPCQPPRKTRSKGTNTKMISKCWKLKKLPKLRRCKKRKCNKRQECFVDDKTCHRRNSWPSLGNCYNNLRRRSISCLSPTKNMQYSTIHNICWKHPCQKPINPARISCVPISSVECSPIPMCSPAVECSPIPTCSPGMECSPISTCTPGVVFLNDCGIQTDSSLLRTDLYKMHKCYRIWRARRNRQKCCQCILTCGVVLCCAPCFLVALCYWLCCPCTQSDDCKGRNPWEMPTFCNKYRTDCNMPYPFSDAIKGRELKWSKKVSFEETCPNIYNLSKRPYFVGCNDCYERPFTVRTSKSHKRLRQTRAATNQRRPLYAYPESYVCNKPCGLRDTIVWSYKKAKSGCQQMSVGSIEPDFCIQQPVWKCSKRCRFIKFMKRIYNFDNDKNGICQGMMQNVYGTQPRRSSRNSYCQFMCNVFRFLKLIVCTCCCCPIFFCFYCCGVSCDRMCCCLIHSF